MMWALPESPRFLVRHPRRWTELIRLLRRLGHAVPDGAAFEDKLERRAESQSAIKSLLGPGRLRDTLGLWFAFFSCLHGAYLIFGWLPAMLAAQGLDLAASSVGLAAFNFGGVIGVLLWTVAVTMIGSRLPLLVAALGAAASALAIGFLHFNPGGGHALVIAGFGLHGLFVNALQTIMYALAAYVYPTQVRASGVAFAAAVGRLGAMLSSFTGAAIIQAGSHAYLRVLALSMVCAFIGLAVVGKHFPGQESSRAGR
jgi:AAHS family 4-hydroxybenzoate transporter-like MFS transporter